MQAAAKFQTGRLPQTIANIPMNKLLETAANPQTDRHQKIAAKFQTGRLL